MYIYIDEYTIEEYKNEILKRYVGNRLIKTISNPTNEDLIEFGYKNLVEDERVAEREGFYIETYYEDGESITMKYRYVEIPVDEIGEEEVSENEVQPM